ncbi:hypothetical protein FHR92_005035 [Fontibacillus solani]|uniref:Aminoglycoside phosphotransferase domain-containing protein n=1 Tax=Fontibacillus solani TaxID=1572857 RepID=A0A7W3XUD9_9BACL|nr:phosphotransferase [Fontibacillus solani]MBA9088519.1 hypothetical protein [Fontibacillus solani]
MPNGCLFFGFRNNFEAAAYEVAQIYPAAKIVVIFPYGMASGTSRFVQQRLLTRQLAQVGHDLIHGPSRRVRLVSEIIREHGESANQLLLIGHSAGGVVAYRSGLVLGERYGMQQVQVFAVGSPKFHLKDIPFNQRFTYISGRNPDRVTRIGSWRRPGSRVYRGQPGRDIQLDFNPGHLGWKYHAMLLIFLNRPGRIRITSCIRMRRISSPKFMSYVRKLRNDGLNRIRSSGKFFRKPPQQAWKGTLPGKARIIWYAIQSKMLIDIDESADEIFNRIEKLPIVLCHRDFWVTNIFHSDGKTILIDWDTTGWGYLGEDLASLIADEADVEHMVEYYLRCIPAYYKGFSEYADISHITDNCVYEMILLLFGYRLVEWYLNEGAGSNLHMQTLQKVYEMQKKGKPLQISKI